MKTVILSERMQTIVSLVTPGLKVCDIGCDHGFVSIYLIQAGIASHVVAMDVRSGPLSQAALHIQEYGLQDYIETRLSDGALKLQPEEVQCVICAGMGGRLMEKILTESREKFRKMQELILQPQSEISHFRGFLRQEGYKILREEMVWEDGKYYPMMKVAYTQEALPEQEQQALFDRYGELLLKGKNPVLKQYLEQELKKSLELEESLKDNAKERAEARKLLLETEIGQIRQAMKMIESL